MREWALECRWFAGEKGRLLCCVFAVCVLRILTRVLMGLLGSGMRSVKDAQHNFHNALCCVVVMIVVMLCRRVFKRVEGVAQHD